MGESYWSVALVGLALALSALLLVVGWPWRRRR